LRTLRLISGGIFFFFCFFLSEEGQSGGVCVDPTSKDLVSSFGVTVQRFVDILVGVAMNSRGDVAVDKGGGIPAAGGRVLRARLLLG